MFHRHNVNFDFVIAPLPKHWPLNQSCFVLCHFFITNNLFLAFLERKRSYLFPYYVKFCVCSLVFCNFVFIEIEPNMSGKTVSFVITASLTFELVYVFSLKSGQICGLMLSSWQQSSTTLSDLKSERLDYIWVCFTRGPVFCYADMLFCAFSGAYFGLGAVGLLGFIICCSVNRFIVSRENSDWSKQLTSIILQFPKDKRIKHIFDKNMSNFSCIQLISHDTQWFYSHRNVVNTYVFYVVSALPSRAVSAARALSAAPTGKQQQQQRSITAAAAAGRDGNPIPPLHNQQQELNNISASLQRPKTVSKYIHVLFCHPLSPSPWIELELDPVTGWVELVGLYFQ